MAQVVGVLGGASLVVVALVALLARRVHRSFPEVVPREETSLSPRTYEVVRTGVVAGGAVGVFGAGVAVVDTLGTLAAASPGEDGVLVDVATTIPEWLASAGPLVGAALLSGSALLALASEVRAWLVAEE